MKKRLFALLLCALMVWSVLPVRAAPSIAIRLEDGQSQSAGYTYVVDEAGLLTAWEADRLEAKARDIAQRYACGVYMVAVDDYWDYGPEPWDAACNIYRDRGLGLGAEQNGLLLLLSMDDRDFATAVYGAMAQAVFTDSVLQLQEDEFLDDFRDNDWYAGFDDYLDFAGDALKYYSQGSSIEIERAKLTPAKLGVVFLQDLGIGVAIALVVCLILKLGMRSVRKGTSARAYMLGDQKQLDVCVDRFTHATETRRVIETNRSSGGGGGSHSHSGGGFSGRSGKF